MLGFSQVWGIFFSLGVSCCLLLPGMKASGNRKTHRPIHKRITPMRPHTLHKPRSSLAIVVENRRQRLFALDLDFPICPARDFDNGIDDGGVVLVRVQRNVMPEGDGVAFVKQPDSPVEGVAGADFAQADGVVVEFAVVGAGVCAGCWVGVVAFGGRTRRFGWSFVSWRFQWTGRWSGVDCCCKSGDEKSMRCVHCEGFE